HRLGMELRDFETQRANAVAELSLGAADRPSGRVWFVNKARETVLIEIAKGVTYRIGSGQERLFSLPSGKFTYRLAWESRGGNFGLEHASEAPPDRPRTLTIIDPGMPLGAASSIK